MSVRPGRSEGGLGQARPGSASPGSSVYPPTSPARSERGLSRERVSPTRLIPPAPERSDPASYRGAADCDAVDANRREADAHRHGLAVLAAGPPALVELQVAADARDAREGLGAVADQRSEERRVGKECRSRWSP